MSETWEFGQFEALWADPDPATPEGRRLWRLFSQGKVGNGPNGIRDFGQRICQIEQEAARPAPPSEGLRTKNYDNAPVHEMLHPGGWCDCGDGPFTHDQWLAHRGPLPEPAKPIVFESVPATLVDDVLPVLSDVLVAYLTEFWPNREGAITIAARADSIVHRLRAALTPAEPSAERTER